MDIARLSSKGQMTVPISVRKALNLKSGDKVIILEENGRYYIENASMLAFNGVEEAFIKLYPPQNANMVKKSDD